jgi:hypothetical protein
VAYLSPIFTNVLEEVFCEVREFGFSRKYSSEK